ncbi:MAG: restriction endonuclease [Gordonia sp. (in: high G+C Gram-positive bacteria)]
MKVISPQAYVALREALPLVVWRKTAFETYVRGALGGHPEVLSGINFASTKRESASGIMDRLMADVGRYQDTTINLMLDIASMTRFPDIETIKDAADRDKWRRKAEDAVSELRRHTAGFEETRAAEGKRKKARAEHEGRAATIRKFTDDIESIRLNFLRLHAMSNHQMRGTRFEVILNELFAVYDMEPKLAYNLTNEQIDGAITFDTDDYVVEAKWRTKPIARSALDTFDQKVRRKGKNALGIFVSISPFTSAALDQYKQGTSFLAVDGEELYFVLENRVRLDDLLRMKKRHANETGSCMMHARDWLAAPST